MAFRIFLSLVSVSLFGNVLSDFGILVNYYKHSQE